MAQLTQPVPAVLSGVSTLQSQEEKRSALTFNLDFTGANNSYALQYQQKIQDKVFSAIRTIFVNNQYNPNPVTFTFGVSGQPLTVGGYSVGYYKALSPDSNGQINVSSVGGATALTYVALLNFDVAPIAYQISPSGAGILITSADGGIATLGSKADAAVTNPATAASLIALTKGMLTALNGTLTAVTSDTGTLGSTAPTAGSQIAGPDTGNVLRAITTAQFHNADNQALGNGYGIIAGGVGQYLNSSGNLDRAREAYADAMAVTGMAASVGMSWNGSSYDRPRSAYADALSTTGVQAASDLLWNGTGFDRPRAVSGDAMAVTGLAAEMDMLWNGTNYDRPRSITRAAAENSGLGVEAAGMVSVFNSTLPTFTNGQYGVAQMNSKGMLYSAIGDNSGNVVTLQNNGSDGLANSTIAFMTTSAIRAMNAAGTLDVVRNGAGAANSGLSGVAVEQVGMLYNRITTSTLIKTGKGFLRRLIVSSPVSATVVIYDNTTATGTAIGSLTIVAGQPFFLDYDAAFSTGLYVQTSTTIDLTVISR